MGEEAAKTTAADVLIETLIDWGVEVVFGLPGDGINGICEALRKRQDRIRFIQARHEEAASFMACAWAKFTGKLGCCLATTGPGGVHLLNGLYDAKFDRAPVIAVTGLPYQDLNQTWTQQDIDHTRLFADAVEYSTAIFSATHVENAVSLACRTALAKRGPTHVAIPVDVQDETLEKAERSPRNKPEHVSAAYAESARTPSRDAIEQAAEVLNAGSKVLILAGQGALGASDALLKTAELLGAPVAKALLGKAVIPDDHPHCTGGVGYLGTRPSQKAMAECDTLLIVGSGFPYIEYYPEPGQARCVQIDLDASRISLRYPAEAAVVGDARLSLEALNERLQRKEDRSFLQKAQGWKAEWLAALEAGADRMADPVKPERVVRDLNLKLAEDAVVVTDCGQNTGLTAQYVQMKAGQMFGVSGTLASRGAGVPYAVAAALAHPGREVVAVVGDGGLGMSVAELATLARYQLPVRVVVLNNRALGQIRWEQMLFLGNPEFGCDLSPVDFATVAEGMGIRGLRIRKDADSAEALNQAFAEPGPVLIDAMVDGYEPMLPPKRRPKYMENLEKALDRGTPNRERIEAALGQEPLKTELQD